MGLFDKFRRKEKQEFSFYGTGCAIKSDEEMENINTEIADISFKTCKKEILDVYMKEKGFVKYKSVSYIRLNPIGLIEYVNLQKEAHGSRTFTLNIALLPLYVSHPFLVIGFGDRIGTLIHGRDFWWDYKDMDTAMKSFQNIVSALDEYVMPWFNKYQDEELYKKDLLQNTYRVGNSFITWTTHIFIKNNDIGEAKQFLNHVVNMDYYKKALPCQKEHMDATIKEMKELVNSISDVQEYIASVEEQNIKTHKFPVNFRKQSERAKGATP